MKKRSKASSNNNTSTILLIITVIILLFSLLFVTGKDQFFSTLLSGKVAAKQESNQFKGSIEPPQDFIEKPDKIKAENTARQLEVATFDMVRTLNNYLISKDKNNEKKLQELALSRKKLLVEVMRNNPDAALQSIMPSEVRDAIATICKDCVETSNTIEGTLEVLHADFFDQGISKEIYTLITKDKKRIRLHPTFGLKESLVSGTKIKVKGLQVDNELLFDGTDSLSEPTGDLGGIEILESVTDSPPVYGDQKTLVVLANFQNTPQPELTTDQAQSEMDIVSSFYRENSYGLVWLSGEINPDKSADVLGWYTIPLDQSCNIIFHEVIDAVDPIVNFNDYSRLIIVMPFGFCGWGGVGTIGKGVVSTQDGNVNLSISWVHEHPGWITIGHELGHNFGNHHASFLVCTNTSINKNEEGCTLQEYGDRFDIMGGGRHYNTLHKEYTGWFNQPGKPRIETITSSGAYTIEPIETDTNGIKALKIQRKLNDYLFVEYRQLFGFDSILRQSVSDSNFAGALIHIRAPNGIGGSLPYKSALLDLAPPFQNTFPFTLEYSLIEGGSFIDPASGTNITVIQNSQDLINQQNSRLTIKVNLGKTEFLPPNVSIESPVNGSTVSGNVTVVVSATDASGIDKVEFYKRSNEIDTLFATDTIEPYDAVLDTTQMPNSQIPFFPAINNFVFAKAYDNTGVPFAVPGNDAYSQIVMLNVTNTGDLTPPNIEIVQPSDGELIPERNPVTLVPIVAEASDNIGVWFVYFIISTDGVISDYKIPYIWAPLIPVGQSEIRSYAYDFQGNIGLAPVITFTVSNTPPILSFISNQSIIVGSILSFSINAEDINGDILDIGINNLYDLNNDRAIDQADIDYMIDIALGINPYYTRADLDQDGDVDIFDILRVIWQDGWVFTITQNNPGVSQGTFSWKPNFNQIGNHIVNFTVSDESGNSDSQVVTITVLAAGGGGGGGGGGGEPGKFII